MLYNICFLGQSDADFDTFLKPCLFMVPAEGAYRIDNLIYFLGGFAVHGCVKIMEVLSDGLTIEAVEIHICIEQQLQ